MKRHLLITLLFSLFIFQSFAQKNDTFRLDSLSIDDGLSNSSVSAILQDDRGFMWFGTQSGLCRYDGYNFENYYNDPFDENSLPHNQIQCMFRDNEDVLWLGTYNGLSRLNTATGDFTNYPNIENDSTSLSNSVVVAIARDAMGRLWVGTLDGLNLLDENKGTFTRFYNEKGNPFSLPDNSVRTLLKDNNGNLWIGTYGGLSLWNEQTHTFENFQSSEDQIQITINNFKKTLSVDDPRFMGNDDFFKKILKLNVDEKTIPSNYVMTLTNHPFLENTIIVGTWKEKNSPGGVALFNTESKEVERIESPGKRVYSLITDDRERLWIGTWGNGLVLYNLRGNSYHLYSHKNGDDLSNDIVYSLTQDNSGVVWIGTNGGGINKFVDWKNKFSFLKNNPHDPYSLPSGKIISALQDSKGYLWFGIQGYGISRYDRKNGLFRNYKHIEGNEHSLSNSLVNVLFEDHQGDLWVGTNDGLNQYNRETDDFNRYYSGKEKNSLPDNLIYSIAEDHKGNLWLGSYTKGIYVRDPEGQISRRYKNENDNPDSLSDNLVRSLFVDSLGEVWACTNKGLNRYSKGSDSFIRYMHDRDDKSSLSSNDVRQIFEDSDGDLWIATNGGGVNLYDRGKETFSLISTEDGLLSNSVIAIDENDKGQLLFVTIPGISVYSKRDKSFSIIDKKTGLLSSELTSGFVHTSDGSLYVGGTDGITYIPNITKDLVLYKPEINIKAISILGIPYNDGRAVWSLNNLTLDYSENVLSFEFFLSDYSAEGQNQFAYKLDGFDKDWSYSGNRNYAQYTNLDPGNYEFKVIGADSRNNWNLNGTSLSVLIKPPFWRSTYAYFTYFILGVFSIIFLFTRFKKKQNETIRKIDEQKALNIELENRVQKRTAQIEEARQMAEEATRAKSLFLANISHELRTPLNAVVGFSELLNEEDFSSEKRHIVTSIKTAGKSLTALINDLLDLSKLEAGKMKIHKTPTQLTRVLFEIGHIFKWKAEEKNLKFILDIDPQLPDELMIDETRFRQILINLVGNSVKFTDKGLIKVSVSVIGQRSGKIDLKVDVIDTGCGINDKEIQRIFDLFWQSDRRDLNKPVGTGLGLPIIRNLVSLMNGSLDVKSEKNHGTTVSIVFKNMTVVPIDEQIIPIQKTWGKQKRFDKVKVLIADDIADNRNLLIEMMKRMNIETISAENGKDAYILTVNEKPDLVFMDLQMPIMDGYTSAVKIKDNPEISAIPVVAVTASLQSDLPESGNNRKFFSDYIVKPFTLNKIREVMVKLVGQKEQGCVNALKNSNVQNNSPKEIDDRENLIVKIENFKKEWMDLKPSGRMSRLEDFSVRLKDTGKKHKAEVLVEYAEIFLSHIKAFDLKAIEKDLKKFPLIISEIENG